LYNIGIINFKDKIMAFKIYKNYIGKDVRVSVYERQGSSTKEGICFKATYLDEDIWGEGECDIYLEYKHFCLKRDICRTEWADKMGHEDDHTKTEQDFKDAITAFDRGNFEHKIIRHFLDQVDSKINLHASSVHLIS